MPAGKGFEAAMRPAFPLLPRLEAMPRALMKTGGRKQRVPVKNTEHPDMPEDDVSPLRGTSGKTHCRRVAFILGPVSGYGLPGGMQKALTMAGAS